MDYPVWDLSIGGALLMALVAIPHVIVAHFAVGGGLLLAVSETLSVRRDDAQLRELAKRSSLMLVLVATVFGAVSGVGIWVVAGLISPAAISALIHTYVWGWAIEWVFFVLEIVAALVYYTTWDKITKRAHLMVGWLYFVGAYLSLVVINGIITFMLTPGRWLETRAFWDGFFNPTYWPSLVMRTGIAMLMAAAFMVFVVLRLDRDHRPRLMRYLGWWLAAGVLVAYAGYRWWEAALPETVSALFLGPQPLLPALADTRSFMLWALAATLVVGVTILIAAPRLARTIPLVAVAVAAMAFFSGYERLREGARKPFLIHSYLFSNGLLVDSIEAVNETGILARTGWARPASDHDVDIGRQVFRTQCASCHTLDGYQGIRRAVPTVEDWVAVAADEPAGRGAAAYASECARCHPDISYQEMAEMIPSAEDIEADPEMVRDLNVMMIVASLTELHSMGAASAETPVGTMIQTADLRFPYMPPFVGSDAELEALAAYLASLDPGDSTRLARSEVER